MRIGHDSCSPDRNLMGTLTVVAFIITVDLSSREIQFWVSWHDADVCKPRRVWGS